MMFVNNVSYLMSTSHHIRFVTAEMIKSMNFGMLMATLKPLVNAYRKADSCDRYSGRRKIRVHLRWVRIIRSALLLQMHMLLRLKIHSNCQRESKVNITYKFFEANAGETGDWDSVYSCLLVKRVSCCLWHIHKSKSNLYRIVTWFESTLRVEIMIICTDTQGL